MQVPLENEVGPVVGPIGGSRRIHKVLLLNAGHGAGEIGKEGLRRGDVIGLQAAEVGRRDVGNGNISDAQRYKRPRGLLTTMIELMGTGEVDLAASLE